jgi:tetratricopeptide (TPR) repeat protein
MEGIPMKLKLRLLMAGVALAALAGCAAGGGMSVAGIGDSKGCRTIYVFRPPIGDGAGVVQPMNSCGNVPRDGFAPQASKLVQAQEAGAANPNGGASDAPPPVRVSISAPAETTRPAFAPKEAYPGPNEMIENADMAAFMTLVRSDYASGKNSGAWGFVILDALAANEIPMAQDVLDAMAKHNPQPEILSADHLRPWVQAAAGRVETAETTMAGLRRILPGATLMGHRALLAEGAGDIDGALKIYAQAPSDFTPPDPDEAGSPGYLAKAMAFNSQRLLALRHAELLRAVNRDDEAIAILVRLNEAAKDDGYVKDRLEKARKKEDRHAVRNLDQALSLAIADEADLVDQRQSIMGMMVGGGAEPPFNYLISSLRQSALLLDPDNGDIRLQEVNNLYQHGYFDAALRLAQIGNPDKPHAAGLYAAAALAALELGSPDAMSSLVERSLELDSSPQAKVSASAALTTAGKTDRAIQLVDQALKAKLDKDEKVAALMQKGQAKFQAGDVAGAVEQAKAARALNDNEATQQFLASMLVKSPQRAEGLAIMRKMLSDSPGNVGMMNNFGYSLVDGYASQAELDEGFKLLKEASRLSPQEPNLLDSLAWAYYQYGDFRTADRYVDLALDAYKPFHHWELFSHKGDIAWRLGEQDVARKNWKLALESRPPDDEKAGLTARIQSGPPQPAPEVRDTPEVPLNRNHGETIEL